MVIYTDTLKHSLTESEYNSNGILLSQKYYQYNFSGNLIMYKPDALDKKFDDTYEYFYKNSSEQLEYVIRSYRDETFATRYDTVKIYFYDSSGKLIQRKKIDDENTSIWSYSFDAKGFLIEEDLKNIDYEYGHLHETTVNTKIIFEYNLQGFKSKVLLYDKLNEPEMLYSYEYVYY